MRASIEAEWQRWCSGSTSWGFERALRLVWDGALVSLVMVIGLSL
jgi:hypothetical protein